MEEIPWELSAALQLSAGVSIGLKTVRSQGPGSLVRQVEGHQCPSLSSKEGTEGQGTDR